MEGQNSCKIKWKCLNCDILMCNKCKDKIHVKLKFENDHTLINIKEVGMHRKALNFSEYAGQSVVMFCTSCIKNSTMATYL